MNALSHLPKRPAASRASIAAHPALSVLPLTGAHVEAHKDVPREAHNHAYNPLWPMVFAMAIFFGLIAALAAG